MTFEVTFLGTASMVPTKERNVQGIYIDYKGEESSLTVGKEAKGR
jgi:ribonuclease BN (tRNA processing enzyme)